MQDGEILVGGKPLPQVDTIVATTPIEPATAPGPHERARQPRIQTSASAVN